MRTSAYIDETELGSLARSWLDEIRSQTAPRPRLELDADRAALLVIDMLRYFADPSGRCHLPAATAIIGRIQSLIAAWRALGRPVIFTRHCHEGQHDLGMLGRFFSDYIRAGEPDAEIVPALAPSPGELVFKKTTYDAFLGTDLEATLRKKDIEQVVITGVLTHMCCETTARAAFCRGFEVYVPVDAVASSTEERHLGSLLAMADSVAVMHSTQEVLERCATNK
ncbi:MAG: cysteine hydrolase [Deltaproteobacteria bacterium]|nr:cysteine hydrolase [Deltaproteobacteria bacterium]